MAFDRRPKPTSSSAPPIASAIGSTSLTQRHVARTSEPERAANHAAMDAAWSGAVQLARDEHSGLDDASIQRAAAHGISGSGGSLPYLETIQRSFGDHDVGGVRAHVGGAAREASAAMGAHGYATGNDVAFAETPSLFLVAHEAAHVVQQRGGVQLSSSVGRAGDSCEQQADAVAARVVAGQSAADLLGPSAAPGVQRSAIQRKEEEKGKNKEEDDAVKQEVEIEEKLSKDDQVRRKDSLDNVAANFLWIADKVGPHLDELKSHILEEDAPSWAEKLLDTALEVALSAGAAGFAELLAVRFAEKALTAVKGARKEAGQEFVKALIEEGTNKGIEAGKKHFEGGSKEKVAAAFILAQRDGATDMYKEDQSHFHHVGRHQVKTVEDAKALEEAANETYKEAPELQYRKALDAWVTFLAQSRYGVKGDRDYGDGPTANLTTDMSNQARRDRVSHSDNGHGYDVPMYHGPKQAPDKDDDDDQGVLYVMAYLPEIGVAWSAEKMRYVFRVEHRPYVTACNMNGVNDKIRKQYQGQNVASLKIPRQIVCHVQGDDPNFTLNLDEKGAIESLDEKLDWLRKRALAEHPEEIDKMRFTLAMEGVQLLLHDLVTGAIHGVHHPNPLSQIG